MPTYSLTLREPLGRKLTIQEVDNNWLYLQDLASQSGGVGSQGATGPQGATGSAGPQGATGPSGVGGTIDISQIVFGGTPSGLTSSIQFTFDKQTNNLILGESHSITGTSSRSVILGGQCNSFYNNELHLGPYDVYSNSTIIGGYCNQINQMSPGSIIGGGFQNCISDISVGSGIIGGLNNFICYSTGSVISGGYLNCIYESRYSFLSGCYNKILSSNYSNISGNCNKICEYSNYSAIQGGFCNIISCDSCMSSIIGGNKNIVGSQSCNSVIIGGQNLTLDMQCETVLVPNLWVSGSFSSDCGLNFGLSGNFVGIGSSFTQICVVNGMIVSIT